MNSLAYNFPVLARSSPIEDTDTIVGLAVDSIGGMDWLLVQHLVAPTNIPNTMAPFLRGEWYSNIEGNSSLRLLDQTAILRSARWAG